MQTFRLRDIQANPDLIKGLKFEYRDSEAKTETYSTPEPVAVPEPKVEVPKVEKPKATKAKK